MEWQPMPKASAALATGAQAACAARMAAQERQVGIRTAQRCRTLPNICLACSWPPPDPSTVRPLVSMRCGGGTQTHGVQVKTPHSQLS